MDWDIQASQQKRKTNVAKNRRRQQRISGARSTESENKEELWESLFQSFGRIEVVLLVGAVLLLLVLIYTIQTILSPFLVLGAIVFLLYPLRRYQLARNIMWLSIILFGLWFAYEISGILAPFVVSIVIAYILNPVVDQVEEWNVPRWITSLVLIIVFVGVIALGLFFVLPIALSQLESILDGITRLVSDLSDAIWKSQMLRILERYGVSAEEVRKTLTSQFAPRVEDISKNILTAILTLVSSLSHFVTQIFYVVLVPFLTFYLLTDFPKIRNRFRMLFPGRLRDRVAEYLNRADALIGRYLRGALTVAFFQAIVIASLFSLFGIKNAIVLGLIAGVLDLVPYFGLLISLVLSAIVAVFSEPPVLPKVLFAISTILVLHLLEVTFLSPRIVGSKVGLHPLLIILSLLVFSYFLGFVGLLIAVPTTALIILFVREWEAGKRGISVDDYHSAKQ